VKNKKINDEFEAPDMGNDSEDNGNDSYEKKVPKLSKFLHNINEVMTLLEQPADIASSTGLKCTSNLMYKTCSNKICSRMLMG
jgi:hypothetical protein